MNAASIKIKILKTLPELNINVENNANPSEKNNHPPRLRSLGGMVEKTRVLMFGPKSMLWEMNMSDKVTKKLKE